MKHGIKIVTIGGGSSYTPELIEGFILRSDELKIREICLVDIEQGKEKLEIVGAMAKRMIKKANLDWVVTLSTDRRDVLADADYVTTQFRVGGLEARAKDERIPLSHGMIGQETNGAGGIFKAFRTIPVILDIIHDMEELCPNAWLINFTNPAGMVTEAAINVGGWNKTIGLCNIPILFEKNCQAVMETKGQGEDLFVKFAGLNHFHWHRAFTNEGKDVTDVIIEELYNSNNFNDREEVANIRRLPFHYEQVKNLGVLPCSYHRYYYITQDMLDGQIDDFASKQTRAEVVMETEKRLFELYKDPDLDYKPEELSKRGGRYYSDAACELINSIENDKRTIMVVSTQNNGALSDLSDKSIVEVSSIITAHGAEPLAWGEFSAGPRASLQLMKGMEELVIEAATTGDYGAALQAFTLNPLIPSGTVSKKVLDELFLAHEDYLPLFNEAIAKLK
ncbi:6-phospho-beta-glucosidase [Erysipelothrix urinaevulpis]|uniref:6-phospho-beta-glucosidase n=1 Tax=Erysipelothrix urinaevulpis TaxID=2683717 RepID=UPI00135C9ED2|nr:6-phospho-beta-glucosidase [Erysipelothrix urinaevulpis]